MKLVINVIKLGKGKDMDNSIEFQIPEGLEMPDGIKPGDTFESLATLMLGEEGELYLKELDGTPVSAESEEEDEPEDMEEGEMGFLDAVERRASEDEE